MERSIEIAFGNPELPTGMRRERTTEEKAAYVATTILYLAIIPLTFVLLGIAIVFDGIKDGCNPSRYNYLEGTGPIRNTIHSVYVRNVCMLFGALSIPFGGVVRSSDRIAPVVREVVEHDADLVCLQEVSQDAALNLYDLLSPHYRFFYFRINPDPVLSLDSSLFVASKVPLTNLEVISIPQGDRIRRAAFRGVAGDLSFITTHLQPGDGQDSENTRRAQAEVISRVDVAGRRALLLGDLNMHRPEYQRSPFARVYRDPFPGYNEVDYIAGNMDLSIAVSPGDTTVSDHSGLFAEIR